MFLVYNAARKKKLKPYNLDSLIRTSEKERFFFSQKVIPPTSITKQRVFKADSISKPFYFSL
jgi:hypothetical protein